MIYAGELAPDFTRGKIIPFTNVLGVLLQVEELALLESGPERDAAIRENFEEEIAKQLIGRAAEDVVWEEPIEWDETEEPHEVGAGFVYAEELNWEAGSLSAEISDPEDDSHLFWDASPTSEANFDAQNTRWSCRDCASRWMSSRCSFLVQSSMRLSRLATCNANRSSGDLRNGTGKAHSRG